MPTLEGVDRGFRPLILKTENVVSTSLGDTSCVLLPMEVPSEESLVSSRGSDVASLAVGMPEW